MRRDDLDFELPEALVAQRPAEPRDACKLFAVGTADGQERHVHFFDLPEFLKPTDTLVVNDSRVIAARLFVEDEQNRPFELLLLEPTASPFRWRTLVRPGRKLKTSLKVRTQDGTEAILTREADVFFVTFPESKTENFFQWLDTVGVPPLPPYIERKANADDEGDYQTVYAAAPGSIAAPTAGLHFTERLLETIEAMGVNVLRVTLHVGYGTFAPIQADDLDDHPMHAERYSVSEATWARLQERKRAGGRVIAVGTTALRTLESIPSLGLDASTRILIQPGYRFQVVDGLITNFHLPKTTLLALLAALVGSERWLGLYQEAVRREYRFFSYGDAMLCLPLLDPQGTPSVP